MAALNDFASRTAFISGGSSGIGLGIAEVLLAAGMNVAIGYRTAAHREEALAHLASFGDQLMDVAVDVADRASLATAAGAVESRFGAVDVLVINAGVFLPASITDTTPEDWDWELGINLTGAFNTLKAFLPMLAAGDGPRHIVATSSILGLMGSPGASAYAASKFGVVGLMESLRAELAPDGIGVSVYCPGTVATNVAGWRRNRPEDASGTVVTGGADLPASVWQESELAISPREAGELVLRGILDNRFFILSHPEYSRALDVKAAALKDAQEHCVPSTTAREEISSMFAASIPYD